MNALAARSDATRNRARLLEAAGELTAARGSEVDVREIARRAGVGMGTLYRHFPTKQALLDAVLEHAYRDWARAAREAVTDDAWADLARFLDDALARQSRNRRLLEGYGDVGHAADAEHCRQQLRPVVVDLVERAVVAGQARPDLTAEDVSLLLIALGRLAPLAPRVWRRPLRVALDGMRAGAPGTLPGVPLTPDELDAALAASGGRGHP